MLKGLYSVNKRCIIKEIPWKETISLQGDKIQALQEPNLQWQPSKVGKLILYTVVAPDYELELRYIQVSAPLETAYAIEES